MADQYRLGKEFIDLAEKGDAIKFDVTDVAKALKVREDKVTEFFALAFIEATKLGPHELKMCIRHPSAMNDYKQEIWFEKNDE